MSKKILIDQSVLEQALKALDEIAWSNDTRWQSDCADSVRLKLRAALEQTPVVDEQEPVAWMFHVDDVWKFRWHHFNRPMGDEVLKHWKPLYTRPQPRQPLTDEQIHEAAIKANREGKLSWTGFQLDNNGEYTIPLLSLCHYQLARAIECAHGISK